ncbi:splicing factor SF3a60 homolog isoform X2 [Tripterygium wilfordii]|uniref:splicing factor SF3a60 homolog isoform X2 n=1 Tax=Tripterygium wilfordii TaxID=458696 RepID=UPI0018F828E5|nr:splicing factor SF3a60 homolog isoform X2 [Tripterygium wilfordii]
MSSTLLEVTRAAHEEVERFERLIVKDLQNEPSNAKDRLFQSHRVRHMIDTISVTTEKLIRDYHRRHPAARVVDANEEYEAMLKEEPSIEFSGEEAFGRYLDLHEMYHQYINSKFGEKIEYAAYLDVFSEPQKISRKLRMTRQYRDYMVNLLEYLIYFFQRTEPLQDLDRIFSKVVTEFEEQWMGGMVEGWEKDDKENGHAPGEHTAIDLDYYSSVEELMEVGPEKLKEALAGLGLKTGGTVQQRAERLFLTKHTPLEQLDKKHFAKGSRSSEQNGDVAALREADNSAEIALMEAKVAKLCDFLNETIERTKENVVKKQAMTYDEIEAEREDEETQADSESDDEDQQIYNPLKLPMGWDGKPIPYWLYKLHGLGQEFKCEICGNYSYWGRRAFERHFKEWRHQHGMRCLGIPNTKNFNEITSIEEAKELWKRIQERQGVNKWRPDLEEEYEDKEGNIYNKKTYTDLQRQGLI